GLFRPEGELYGFDGIDPNGTWTLEISDNANFDVGTLNSWSITFSTGERFGTSDALGNFEIDNLNVGPTPTLREQLPAGWRRTQPAFSYYAPSVPAGAGVANLDFGAHQDNTPPVATFTPVAPNPRNTPVPSITVQFGEQVTNFDLSDLMLFHDGN